MTSRLDDIEDVVDARAQDEADAEIVASWPSRQLILRAPPAAHDWNVLQVHAGLFGARSSAEFGACVAALVTAGGVFAIATRGSLVGIVRLDELDAEARIFSPDSVVTCLAVFEESCRFVTGMRSHGVYLWSVIVGEGCDASIEAVLTGHSSEIICVAVHGTLVLAGAVDGSLRMWDVAGGDVQLASMRTLLCNDFSVACCHVAFSPDGCRAASANSRGSLRLWDIWDATGAASPSIEPLKDTWSDADEVCGLCFASDGCSLLVASASGMLHEWYFNSEFPLGKGRPCAGIMRGSDPVCFHPRWLLAAGRGSLLTLVDAPTGAAVCCVATAAPWGAGKDDKKAHDGLIVALCFVGDDDAGALAVRRDGALVVVGRGNGGWTPCGGGAVAPTCSWQRHQAHASAAFGCAFSPSGRSVVSAGEDGLLRSLAVSGRGGNTFVVASAEAPRRLCFCARSPSGSAMAVGGAPDGSTRIYRTATGDLLATLRGAPQHTAAVYCAAFSSVTPASAHAWSEYSAAMLITGSHDATLAVWDIHERCDPDSGMDVYAKLRTTLPGHDGPVWGVGCTHDGLAIVSASADGTLKVWTTASRECRATLRGHTGGVRCVSVHPSRDVALSGSEECARSLTMTSPRSYCADVPLQRHAQALGSHVGRVHAHAATRRRRGGGGAGGYGRRGLGRAIARARCRPLRRRERGRLWPRRVVGPLWLRRRAPAAVGHAIPAEPERGATCCDLDAAIWSVAASRDGERVAVGDAAGVIHVADDFVADLGAAEENNPDE